jgi:hypothetical protein
MLISHRAAVMAVLAAGMLLAACNGAPEDTAARPAAPNKPAKAKVAELPSDMVAAVSAGSTSTIGVHFALKSLPVVNQALPVEIAIVPHREFAAVRAHFEAHDGLALTTGETLAAVTPSPAETPIEHQLVVLPQRDGLFMITVSVETDGDDGAITRVFSIPIIVAPAGSAPAAAPPASNPVPKKVAAG